MKLNAILQKGTVKKQAREAAKAEKDAIREAAKALKEADKAAKEAAKETEKAAMKAATTADKYEYTQLQPDQKKCPKGSSAVMVNGVKMCRKKKE